VALNYDGNNVTVFQNMTAYTPNLTITDFTACGPAKGGNTVIIKGTEFKAGDRVFFGLGLTNEGTSVIVMDSETIWETAPNVTETFGAPMPSSSPITVKHSDSTFTTSSKKYTVEYRERVPADPNKPSDKPVDRPRVVTGGLPTTPTGRTPVSGSSVSVPAAPASPQPVPLPPHR